MTNPHWWHPSVRRWNTATNVAYPLAGVLVAFVLQTPAAWTFATLLLILGAGSALYHWHGTPTTRYYDWFGMFVVIFGLATYAADPNGPLIHWYMIVVASVTATVLTYAKKQAGREPVLGIGMALVSLPVLGSGVPTAIALGVVSLGLFGMGLALQRADTREGHRGHGWWHILTALGFVTMFVAIHVMGGV